ncbi:HNH endonuclease [Sesbania bispinosa]|nr:HNH endonuclease [Sesbania bispinosa]
MEQRVRHLRLWLDGADSGWWRCWPRFSAAMTLRTEVVHGGAEHHRDGGWGREQWLTVVVDDCVANIICIFTAQTLYFDSYSLFRFLGILLWPLTVVVPPRLTAMGSGWSDCAVALLFLTLGAAVGAKYRGDCVAVIVLV